MSIDYIVIEHFLKWLMFDFLGINVYLKYPYSREIDEQHLYTDIHHHAVTNMIDISSHRHSDNDSYTSESEDSLDKRISYIHPV